MIQGIEIENFRAFHKTEIHGFEQINLFGGKNNVGKTCLLEGLYLGLNEKVDEYITSKPRTLNILDVQKNLFFNLDTKKPFSLELLSTKGNYKICWNIDSGKVIPLKRYINNKDYSSINYPQRNNSANFILSKEEQYPDNLILSNEYDKADITGESGLILKTIQIIDPSVSEIKTYSTYPNTLFLRKNHERISLPIVNYGDALQKVMRYIITIVKVESEKKNSNKYLLIDEIENGLHYTVHKEFWEMLFKLAIEYNIQIFAATHSREMIEAYAEVAQMPEFTGKAAYFEMFRHIKTNEIAANKFNINTLEFNLENNRPLRGEKSI